MDEQRTAGTLSTGAPPYRVPSRQMAGGFLKKMLQLGGTISADGKLSVYDQQKLNEWRMKHAGCNIVLTVKVKRKDRSTPQNAYYWGVVVPIVMDAINKYGNEYDAMDTHEFLKGRFNTKAVDVNEGYSLQIPQSTASLDTKEFGSYVGQIQQFASMVLGVYVPSPNEQLTIDHYLNQNP
jgi:hypothetical protein